MMPTLFPDTEAWAVGYLQPLLAATVGVSDAGSGPRRVLVRRDGGPGESVVTETVRLSVRCFAESETVAHELARLAQAHLSASPGVGPVRRYRLSGGPVFIPDRTGPCYLLTVELTVRGTDL